MQMRYMYYNDNDIKAVLTYPESHQIPFGIHVVPISRVHYLLY